jgi:hypothetical protein
MLGALAEAQIAPQDGDGVLPVVVDLVQVERVSIVVMPDLVACCGFRPS